MDKLKPCPFCGENAADAILGFSGWFIECLGCQARSDGHREMSDAVAAWNRRASDRWKRKVKIITQWVVLVGLLAVLLAILYMRIKAEM